MRDDDKPAKTTSIFRSANRKIDSTTHRRWQRQSWWWRRRWSKTLNQLLPGSRRPADINAALEAAAARSANGGGGGGDHEDDVSAGIRV